MTEATPPTNDVRELEDAGLAGYAAADESAAAAGAGPAPEPAPPELEPYSAEELAQITAGLSALGLPAENLDAYQRAVLARTRPAFQMLGIGEALAAYGIGKGGGLEAMPPWVRLVAGVAVVGFTVVGARREFARGPNDPEPDAEAGASGAA